jgi:hypothetical protein
MRTKALRVEIFAPLCGERGQTWIELWSGMADSGRAALQSAGFDLPARTIYPIGRTISGLRRGGAGCIEASAIARVIPHIPAEQPQHHADGPVRPRPGIRSGRGGRRLLEIHS